MPPPHRPATVKRQPHVIMQGAHGPRAARTQSEAGEPSAAAAAAWGEPSTAAAAAWGDAPGAEGSSLAMGGLGWFSPAESTLTEEDFVPRSALPHAPEWHSRALSAIPELPRSVVPSHFSDDTDSQHGEPSSSWNDEGAPWTFDIGYEFPGFDSTEYGGSSSDGSESSSTSQSLFYPADTDDSGMFRSSDSGSIDYDMMRSSDSDSIDVSDPGQLNIDFVNPVHSIPTRCRRVEPLSRPGHAVVWTESSAVQLLPTGGLDSVAPSASVHCAIQAPIPSSVPISGVVPRFTTEPAQRQAATREQIDEAFRSIMGQHREKAGNTTGNSKREQMWQWAEMLLDDDSLEFASRPFHLESAPAVFREEGNTRRLRGSDKWTNSGGLKGSSLWPGNSDKPRLRCKYGNVTAPGGATKWHYRVYSFTGRTDEAHKPSGRQSRRLYVVWAKSPKQPVVTVRAEVPVAVPSHQVGTIDALVASLESQAADTARRVDTETIYQLLRCVVDLPDAESRLIHKYERPSVMDRTQHRRIYVEKAELGKTRRQQARAHAMSAAAHSPLFDKWTNTGGKRGLLTSRTASGVSLQRRGGRIDKRLAGSPSDSLLHTGLNYFQYCIEAVKTPTDETGSKAQESQDQNSGTATVFLVFDKETKLAEHKRKRTAGRDDRLPEAGRPAKQQSLTRGMAFAGALMMFVATCTIVSRRLVTSPATDGQHPHQPQQEHQCAATNRWDAETVRCQQKLDAFCNSALNAGCVDAAAETYGNAALPMVGLYDSNTFGVLEWRCYPALSVKDGRWDRVHTGYCVEHTIDLSEIYASCNTPGAPPLPKTLAPPCRGFLAGGGTCSPDLAFGASFAGASFAGACNLACGFNEMDTQPYGLGPGSCEAAIASGNHTCELDFAPGGQLAGQCDFACGYCVESDMPASPSVAPCTSVECTCLTADTWLTPGSYQTPADNCKAALAPIGQLSCDTNFAYGGDHQGWCDQTCGFNAFDSTSGAGSCAKLLASGQMSCGSHFGPTGP